MVATASILSGSTAPQRVMSPTFSIGPQTQLPKLLLSPHDIESAIESYDTLLQKAKSYRNALATLSQEANAFGAALEDCARLKGVDDAAEGLSNVAGLHFILANRHSVLSDTVYRSFEIPLRENLENFVTNTAQRRDMYAQELSAKKKKLEKREKAHIALGQKNKRSLDQFREALTDLTKLADDIDKLKSDYFYNCLDDYSETWARVGVRSNIVCKAELSLYSGIAQKAEQLEWCLVGTPDPWSSESRTTDEIFSIVPPQEILARPQSPPIIEGLFQSLLGTIESSMQTPVPIRAFDTGVKVEKRDTQPNSNRIKPDSVESDDVKDEQHEEPSFETPRATHMMHDESPYQDADEVDNEYDKVSRSDATTERSNYFTPSRPVSRRTDSVNHVTMTATKAHPMTTTPKKSPSRPRTSENGTSDLERDYSPAKPTVKVEPLSPGSDTGVWKHSEYSVSQDTA